MNRRYYWLKLKNDFFKDKRIKKLRKIAGGDTYTIIYLKMQLLSLQDEGMLYYDGVEDTFEEEIALQIDEDVEDVKITIGFLLRHNLLIQDEGNEYQLPETINSIGSETASTIRSRKSRENKKLLQCNTNATKCNGEIDIEKDIDIDKKEIYKEKRFKKPTLEEVIDYCNERNNGIDAQRFIDFYESKDWMIGKNKMKDWKACIRTWENKNKSENLVPSWFNNNNNIQNTTIDDDIEFENILKEIGE